MSRTLVGQREIWNSVRPIRPYIFHKMDAEIVPGCLVQHGSVIFYCLEVRNEDRGKMCLCVPNGVLDTLGFYSTRWPSDGLAEGDAYYFGTVEDGEAPE